MASISSHPFMPARFALGYESVDDISVSSISLLQLPLYLVEVRCQQRQRTPGEEVYELFISSRRRKGGGWLRLRAPAHQGSYERGDWRASVERARSIRRLNVSRRNSRVIVFALHSFSVRARTLRQVHFPLRQKRVFVACSTAT